jgi:hypothetical protein
MHHDFRTNVLALSILVVLAVPSGLLQAAIAQDLTVEDNLAQRIVYRTFQEITQDPIQEQTQSNTADVSQDETTSQANVLETGENTASTRQVGDNDCKKCEVEAKGGDAKSKKKGHSDGGDATASLEQDVDNEATTIQDSSADGNVLTNNNEFGDDIALID